MLVCGSYRVSSHCSIHILSRLERQFANLQKKYTLFSSTCRMETFTSFSNAVRHARRICQEPSVRSLVPPRSSHLQNKSCRDSPIFMLEALFIVISSQRISCYVAIQSRLPILGKHTVYFFSSRVYTLLFLTNIPFFSSLLFLQPSTSSVVARTKN